MCLSRNSMSIDLMIQLFTVYKKKEVGYLVTSGNPTVFSRRMVQGGKLSLFFLHLLQTQQYQWDLYQKSNQW
jgi:hypothetical protein